MKIKLTKGFTLIEVLLGLTIFAIIALSLYNIFWLGMKIDKKSHDINQSFQEAGDAFDVLSRDLENAFVYDYSASYPQELSFKGKDDQMVFLLPTANGITSVRFYSGLLSDDRIDRIIINEHMKDLKYTQIPVRFLIRQETPLVEYLSKKEDVPEGEVMVASLKTEGLKFSYGVIKNDPNSQKKSKTIIWQDTWEDNSLPNAVRVTMTLFDPQHPNAGIVLKRDIYLPLINTQQ